MTSTSRRGVINARAIAEPFLAGADQLFAGAPVRGLKLTVFQQKKHLAKLAAVLAKWPLRNLDLSRCQLDARQLQTLLAEANLSQLETLTLIDNPIEEEGAKLVLRRGAASRRGAQPVSDGRDTDPAEPAVGSHRRRRADVTGEMHALAKPARAQPRPLPGD